MALTLPPYGYIQAGYQWEQDTRRFPDTFCVDGQAGTAKQFKALVNKWVDEMAEFLWPRFDKASQSWKGTAAGLSLDLTKADLDLMAGGDLRLKLASAVTLDGQPVVSPATHQEISHKQLFFDEDESKKLGSLDPYLANYPLEALQEAKNQLGTALRKFGPSLLQFKEAFQRPRPYQVAFMLNREFHLEWAKSSMTPSLCSGHSLQGVIGGCGLFLALRLELENAVGATQGVKQFCIDFGDRRVFAGVHYPSDNIASWFLALRFCDHLFGSVGQVAKNFIWEAVQMGAVYKAIAKAVASDAGSPFASPLQKLREEAVRPAQNIE